MTTRLSFEFTKNICEQNDVYNVDINSGLIKFQPCALSLFCDEKPLAKGRVAAIRCLMSLFHRIFPNEYLWLLASHNAWQKDNRISKYKKFWSSLNINDKTIENGKKLECGFVASENRIRFSGALQLTDNNLNMVDEIMKSASIYLAWIPDADDNDIVTLLGDGIEDYAELDLKLLEHVLSKKGLLCKVFGSFDDKESGVVIFGVSEKLNKLKEEFVSNYQI